jgi:hypothetical protein
MLRKASVLNAINVADTLRSKSLVTEARPGTILGELTAATVTPAVTNSDPNEYATMVESMNDGLINEPTTHDRRMDEIVPFLANSVTRHLSFARNVVQPAIDRFLELVNEYYRPQVVASESFNIVAKSLPRLSELSKLNESLMFYKNTRYPLPQTNLTFTGNVDNDKLLSLFVTGESDLDSAYRAFFKDNEELIQVVYDQVFKSPNFNQLGEYVTNTVTYDLIDSTTRLLIVYIIAEKFFDNVEDVAENVSLSNYKDTMAAVRDYAGSNLYNQLQSIKAIVSANTLVITMDNATVTVYEPVYKKWLAAGNSQEALFGMLILKRNYSSTYLIDEHKAELEAAWFNHLSYSTNSIKLSNFNNLLDAFALAYKALHTEYQNDAEKAAMSTPDYYAVSDKLFNDELKDVRMMDLADMRSLALRLVAKSRYYYSSAYEILSALDNYCKDNENLDPREAALLATIEYVARYMAKQLTVSKVK